MTKLNHTHWVIDIRRKVEASPFLRGKLGISEGSYMSTNDSINVMDTSASLTLFILQYLGGSYSITTGKVNVITHFLNSFNEGHAQDVITFLNTNILQPATRYSLEYVPPVIKVRCSDSHGILLRDGARLWGGLFLEPRPARPCRHIVRPTLLPRGQGALISVSGRARSAVTRMVESVEGTFTPEAGFTSSELDA